MQVLVTTVGSGTPELKPTDGTDSGATKLHVDLQTGETDTISVPAQGILFETDINAYGRRYYVCRSLPSRGCYGENGDKNAERNKRNFRPNKSGAE